MAKLKSLTARCRFCRKMTDNLLPEGRLPEGWVLLPDPNGPNVKLLCCPDCIKHNDNSSGFCMMYGVPF